MITVTNNKTMIVITYGSENIFHVGKIYFNGVLLLYSFSFCPTNNSEEFVNLVAKELTKCLKGENVFCTVPQNWSVNTVLKRIFSHQKVFINQRTQNVIRVYAGRFE